MDTFEEMTIQLTSIDRIQIQMNDGNPPLTFSSSPTLNLIKKAHVLVEQIRSGTSTWNNDAYHFAYNSGIISFQIIVEGRTIGDGFFTARLLGSNHFYKSVVIEPISITQGNSRIYNGLVEIPASLNNGNIGERMYTLEVQYLGIEIEKQMCSRKDVIGGSKCRKNVPLRIVVQSDILQKEKDSQQSISNNEINVSNNNNNNSNNGSNDKGDHCNRQFLSNVDLSGSGHWMSNRWIPKERCKFKQFSNDQIQQCLENKKIVIFGDSHMRGVYQALLDKLSKSGRHHQKFQEDVAVRIGTTELRFWWTNTAFFSPPHLKAKVENCQPSNCYFLGGYYLAGKFCVRLVCPF
jgi:hypothetical protein